MAFPAAWPEVPVGALAPALAYYRDRLGFHVDWDNEELGLAAVSQGASQLYIAAPHYRAHMGSSGGPIVIWLSLASRAEVDELHARWSAAGVTGDGPPELNAPWSLYEFLAYDPDGNIFRVYHFVTDEEREPAA